MSQETRNTVSFPISSFNNRCKRSSPFISKSVVLRGCNDRRGAVSHHLKLKREEKLKLVILFPLRWNQKNTAAGQIKKAIIERICRKF